ncbi:glycerol kinase 5 [Arctopsyche grandis]|uniref:glycerol kinase 5 n=1 Tax=Arctopsyche grandis TaxID=121162 RepID=UPI00406D675A
MSVKFVASLDIGTTTVVCRVFDQYATPVGHANGHVTLHYPNPGYVEINPEELWNTILTVLRNAIKDANLTPDQITSLGICTQRATFTTWDRNTGDAFHNFITWKDLRADKLVEYWNNSITMKSIRVSSYMLYMVTRSKRFLAGSIFKFMNKQVTMRLVWALENVPVLKHAVDQGRAMFGTLDTWLLYRLSGRKLHVTDYSNASATGFYDPFTLGWASWAMNIIDIPKDILPEVVDTAGSHFGHVDESLLGAKIPIACCMADQTASMWGSCCFEPGDIKLTMGTGSFIDINTGKDPHASVLGLYPLVAWKYGSELIYMAEGSNNDTGSIMQWAESAGLIEDPTESSNLANSVSDSDGVYFVPAFTGLGPPINDQAAAAGFIGMKLTTRREHLVRSLLEAIVFRAVQLYRCVLSETSFDFHSIRVDGGVSRNDFISQLISDMTGLKLERAKATEISALGCAYLTGLVCGIWKSKAELCALRQVDKIFAPQSHVQPSYSSIMIRWEDAIKRFGGWYHHQNKTNAVSPRISYPSVKTIA